MRATRIARRLLAAALTALALPALAGWEVVQVELPVPPRLDTTGLHRVLVASFVTSDHPTLDLNREVSRYLRRTLSRGTRFEVLDVDPPAIPEQPLDELLANDVFWKKLGKDFGADLIVSGRLRFETQDRSGFVQVDQLNPATQQKVRRTQYAEREEFLLDLNLFFFKGDNGAFLYEDTFRDNALFEGTTHDSLQILFDLLEGLRSEILGILTRQTRVDPRYLWTD